MIGCLIENGPIQNKLYICFGGMCLACYHPLKRVVTGTYTRKEEVKGKIVERVCQRAMVVPMDYDTDDKPFQIIPCGKCIGCRLEYSRNWANRLMLEYKYHDPAQCWFCTFTYDDENVPVNFYTSSDGREYPSLSLKKAEFQQFNKNLRKHYPDGIRFFAAGEYGESTFRPHVHCIYFSLPLDPEKMVKWTVTDQGFTLYKCPELEAIWNRGNVLVSSVSWETCAYVARYVTKKLNGDAAQIYTEFNIEPEFSLMSRRPGIGKQFFNDHPEVIEQGIHVSAGSRAINDVVPRYYKNLYRLTNEKDYDMMDMIFKEQSKASQDAQDRKWNVQEVNSEAARCWSDYLKSKEYQQKAAAALLKRSDV